MGEHIHGFARTLVDPVCSQFPENIFPFSFSSISEVPRAEEDSTRFIIIMKGIIVGFRVNKISKSVYLHLFLGILHAVKSATAAATTTGPQPNKLCSDLQPCEGPGELCSEYGSCIPNDPPDDNSLDDKLQSQQGSSSSSYCPLVSGMMIYDSVQERCVHLVGSDCETDADCTSQATCHSEWDSSLHRFQGKCRCLSEGNLFENTTSKRCQARAKFGEFCSKDLPCESTSHFLECNYNTSRCECEDASAHVYDPAKNGCVLKLGRDCYDYRRHVKSVCVGNAECVFFFTSRKIPRCRCVKGYVETDSGFCEGGYGTNCNATSPCFHSGGLVCSDEICQCRSPMTQTFDHKLKRCVTLVGRPCNSKLAIPQCGSFASCGRSGGGKWSCQCTAGYSKTLDGTCKLDIGQKCGNGWHNIQITAPAPAGERPGTARKESKAVDTVECNHDAGLACKMGICECFDSELLIYDKEVKLCRYPPNTPKYERCGLLNQNKTFGVKNMTYPVRCPIGQDCIEDSRYFGCSCDVRVHPHGVRHQEFCLKNNLWISSDMHSHGYCALRCTINSMYASLWVVL